MHYLPLNRIFVLVLVLGCTHVSQTVAAETTDAKSFASAAFAKSKTAQSVDDFTQVVELCERALRLRPDEATAKYAGDLASWGYNRRGELRAEAAQQLTAAKKGGEARALDAEALADFTQAITYDANRWKAYHNRGVSLAAEGKFKESLADFNKAIGIHTAYASTWFNRGMLNLELDQFAAAERDLSQAMKLQPDDSEAYVGRGRAQAGANKFREAMADYEKAAQLNPNITGIDVYRAEAYAGLGHPEQAAPLFKRAIANEKTARAYRSAAWFMSTCSDARFVDAELAVKCAQKAIELEGHSDYRYPHTLAAALLAANRTAEAREALQKAHALAPQDQAEIIARQIKQLDSVER